MISPLTKLRLSQVRTEREALQAWHEHWDELDGYGLVLSQPNGGNALRLPARIDFPSGGHIRSAFAHDNLFFISHQTIEATASAGEVHLPIDYTVAFDGNVATYLRNWMKGSTSQLVQMLQAVLRGLNRGRFNWDLMPFLLERSGAILAGKDLTEIYETVLASEWFAALDHQELMAGGQIRSTSSPEELAHVAARALADWDRLLRHGRTKEMIDHRHRLFHASIAKMVLLQLQSPSPRQAARKFQDFLTFLDAEIHCIPLLCARAALDHFCSGGGFAPTSKVSNRVPDLQQRVRNVAWDFLQVQWRQDFTGKHGRKGAFHVPYFLTFDRGLAKLIDIFPQRSCLLGKTLDSPLFFQDFDFSALAIAKLPELGAIIGRFFSLEAHERRSARLQSSPPDLPAIIARLDHELASLN